MKYLFRKFKYIFNSSKDLNFENYQNIYKLEKQAKSLNIKSKIILQKAREEQAAWNKKWL